MLPELDLNVKEIDGESLRDYERAFELAGTTKASVAELARITGIDWDILTEAFAFHHRKNEVRLSIYKDSLFTPYEYEMKGPTYHFNPDEAMLRIIADKSRVKVRRHMGKTAEEIEAIKVRKKAEADRQRRLEQKEEQERVRARYNLLSEPKHYPEWVVLVNNYLDGNTHSVEEVNKWLEEEGSVIEGIFNTPQNTTTADLLYLVPYTQWSLGQELQLCVVFMIGGNILWTARSYIHTKDKSVEMPNKELYNFIMGLKKTVLARIPSNVNVERVLFFFGDQRFNPESLISK